MRWIRVSVLTLAAFIGVAPGDARAEETSPRTDPDARVVLDVQEALDRARVKLKSGDDIGSLHFGDGSNWLRTTTGEWVRGSIDWMREDVLSFDSDEFGELEINMREVAEIHAAKTNTYLLDDHTTLVGPAVLTKDEIAVQTLEGVVVRPRGELWSIVEGGGREIDHWSTTLDAGIGLNRGNSNQADLNLRFEITREDRRNLTEVVYILNLGYADRELNVSRHVVPFRHRVWVTRLWFVEPVVGQLLSDRFQDIRFRAQPAATAGVRFLDIPSRALWDVALGFGYQYLRLVEPFATVENPQHDALTVFQTRARFDFTPDIALILSWVTNLTFTTLGNTNHTGFSELFFEITNILYLQATFLYLRTEEPKPRFDGTLPARNDYIFTLGVSLQLG